ncbi:MAG: transcriptional regulator, MarR family [Firmicutes bacterium]|nr:transcriptional regulator, MarR family [Bacillota bacterium]
MQVNKDALGFILHHSDLKLLKLQRIKFKSFNVTPEQWHLLNRLAEQSGINQKELAKRVDKNEAIVTRMLAILERKQLVRKEIDPEDRRAFLIYLTSSGKEIQDNLVVLAEQTFESLLHEIAADDINTFRQVLTTIQQKLDFLLT